MKTCLDAELMLVDIRGEKIEEGFTIVETLVSIFIFSLVLNAVMFILVRNSNDANSIKNSYIASGLIQEAVEIARNLRDTEWSAGAPWGSLLQDGNWIIAWNSTSLTNDTGAYLKKDNGGFYNYAAGADTIFKRSLVINSLNASEKKVVVNISWKERGFTRALSVEEHLLNWR